MGFELLLPGIRYDKFVSQEFLCRLELLINVIPTIIELFKA